MPTLEHVEESGPEHSPLGASSMHRWSVCPGSIRLSANAPDYSSPYAIEGTQAHILGAHCLEFDQDPLHLVGGKLTNGAVPFEVTQDMAEAVDVYVRYVRRLTTKNSVRLLEHRFDLSNVYKGCFGTGDAVVFNHPSKLLTVADYKHGAGKVVEVKGNVQLRYYGLGALMTVPWTARDVDLAIVQPRAAHPDGPIRVERIAAIDLIEFAADLVKYAKATAEPNAPLKSGDHCQFCKALPTCPEYAKKAQAVARQEFGAVADMAPMQLAEALKLVPLIKAWCQAVDARAYADAEAGCPPVGYKLVNKRATRDWKNDGDIIEYLDMMGFEAAQMYAPRKLKSPAQLEPLVGKGKLDKFVTKEPSGTTLVPVDDPRPEVKRPTAKDEFSVVPNPSTTDPFA